MSKKIIVSGASMCKFLVGLELDDLDGEESVKIYIEDSKFSIPDISDSSFMCDHRGEGFITTYIFKLRQLRNILRQVPDQPLTLIFNTTDIEITFIQI